MIEQNSNVPRIIDRLEKKSWINRIQCPNDGRHTKIGLSPLGISKLAEASSLVEEATSNVLKLDTNEAGQLNNLLEKMRAN
jgi:DNA-binding MarR family transcriptional regulator